MTENQQAVYLIFKEVLEEYQAAYEENLYIKSANEEEALQEIEQYVSALELIFLAALEKCK